LHPQKLETIKFTYLPSEISTLARRGTPWITMMRAACLPACLPIVDLLEDKVRANSHDAQRQGKEKRGKCGSGVGLGHVQCIHLHNVSAAMDFGVVGERREAGDRRAPLNPIQLVD
jgi:hypothetical protein